MLQARILSLAINIPGPVAVARLRELGASAVKIEPPSGDPLARASRAWYEALHEGIDVQTWDLKDPERRAALRPLLASSDLLLTTMRPGALRRLNLDRASLKERFPNLCQLAVFGYAPPAADKAGHDLTYQASLGLVEPPTLPRTLLADLAGSERIVSTALALLLARTQGRGAGYAEVALATATARLAAPWHYGLTQPDGVLGGGLPGYNLYQTGDGWIALAALEPHFWARFLEALDVSQADRESLTMLFKRHSTAEWLAWAHQHDIPLEAVRDLV